TAVSLVHEQSLIIRKTAHTRTSDTALLYSLGLEDYARLILQKDSKDTKIDSLDEDWAIGIPALPIDGGFLSGSLVDAQSFININSVLEQESENRFRALCNNLDVSPDFIAALKDWLDSDQETIDADGAEDDYYTGLEQPYRTGNRLMSDISELLLVKGMDRESYETLKPFITVLPVATTLNLNTIPAEIYSSIKDARDADKFIEEREKDPFSSLEDYKKRMNHKLPAKGISVTSEYFQASGQVTLGEKTIFVNTLIHRDKKGVTAILSRKLGEFS
ncbi:MAG: type II secretion system minor pseudopilin GspK, partial [Gammaproteobacteria bacterium]|nr:type II secretion system minor pseudopilin GspK [Gammaproteobacteria bacterium]